MAFIRVRRSARGMSAGAMLAFVLLVWPGATAAQTAEVRTTFVRLGPGVPAVLYEPATPGDRARVGLVVMHPWADSLSAIHCTELSSRGYRVLCANTHITNIEDAAYIWDTLPPDLGLAVRYLREVVGVSSVALVGHSMGGPLVTYYQAVAENGVGVCRGPEKITQCPDRLAGLPAADGVILLDSHLGEAFATLTYVDPSVVNEQDPSVRNPELDMYDPRNGYTPQGATYSPEFRKRYLAAQGKRHNELIAKAQERLARIQAGQGLYPDDEPFLVHGVRSRLWMPDLGLLAHTRGTYPLLRGDGSVETQVVHSVRVPSGSPREARSSSAALVGNTVRTFLSTHAIRTTADYFITEDSLSGVDWESSNTSAPAHVRHISVPLLIMAMTGHYFLVPDELVFENAASADKQLVFVEGASHGISPCRPCERTPGEFGDTVKRTFDYIDGWLNERF